MNYEDAVAYIEQLDMYGIKLGLGNITVLCEALGNPQDRYKTVHVAGTNGKGSVVAMCSAALREAGHKVGMYTSPYLQTFREKVQVNGNMPDEKAFVSVFLKVREAAETLKKEGIQVTYFEFSTALAFFFFAEQHCDIAVIEVGMGGRLDATNIIAPLVAVITNIEMDHMKHLGDTREKIAVEKAGIVKKGSIVIIGEKDEKIKQQLLGICRDRDCAAVVADKEYGGRVGLLGNHQNRNAAIAEATLQALARQDVEIDERAIAEGLASVTWPGRLEIVQEKPLVILDGAHNPAGIRTVVDYVNGLGRDIILVTGMSEDKDYKEMVRLLMHMEKITKAIIARAAYKGMDSMLLKKEIENYGVPAEIEEDVVSAVRKAAAEANSELVLVTGGLYLIGEARSVFRDA